MESPPCVAQCVGPKLKRDRESLTRMRYWAWFAVKLAVAAVVFRGLFKLVSRSFPPDKDPLAPLNDGMRFLLCDFVLLLCFLLFAGTLYLIVRRSEEHTSELQSRQYLVCRLLLEK